MEMKRPGPGCAVWETTLKCNLKCIHCGSAAGTPRSDELSTEEALDLVEQLKGIGTRGVAMMGGEPFLRTDWSSIARRIRELGMDLSLITNGFIGNPKTYEEIEAIRPDLVTVSLDGGTPETHDRIRGVQGSFAKAIASIDHFVEMGLPTGVITTVHKLNLHELKQVRQLLLGKGVSWQIQMATPFGRLTRDLVLSHEEYYGLAMFIAASQKQYSKKELMVAGAHDMGYFSSVLAPVQVKPWTGCQAGISTLGIQSNGNLSGCLALTEGFTEGNIRQKPLSEIWNSDEFAKYARNVKRAQLGDECKRCAYARMCKGGCSAVSVSMCGGLHKDTYCLHRIEEALEKNAAQRVS